MKSSIKFSMRPSALVSILAFLALAGVCRLAAAGDVARFPGMAGRHKRVPCKGKPQWTYDLYIPSAYARQSEKKLPVLFLSSPVANPGFMRHEDWAERAAVIVVCINDTKNGQKRDLWTEIQDAVIGSVEDTLRVHPVLRFSMGCSGGGMASMRLARLHGDKHAGVVMLAHSGNGEDAGLAKHIAVAFIHGEQDTVHSVGASRGVCKRLTSRGNPTRMKTGPWGHNASTKENREEMLDWMLELMRLTHPKLPPEEVKAAAAEIGRRVARLAYSAPFPLTTASAAKAGSSPKSEALSGLADPNDRLREAERILGLPRKLWQRHARELYGGWFSASYEIASSLTDPVERHEALTVMSEEACIRSCSSADKKKLAEDLRKLRRETRVKKEWRARQIYAQIAVMEGKLPDRPAASRKMRVVNSYVALARKYPDTLYGKKAAEDARRLAGQ